MSISQARVKSLVGKHVYVLTREGEVLDGVLQEVSKDKIYLSSSSKPVSTQSFFPFFNPIIPLVLFDLLAIAESPFFFGSPFFI